MISKPQSGRKFLADHSCDQIRASLEIHKGFLQVPNLDLEQDPSLTALAISSEVPLLFGGALRIIEPEMLQGALKRNGFRALQKGKIRAKRFAQSRLRA